MMTSVDLNEVKRLVSEGGRLLEVLPKAEYEGFTQVFRYTPGKADWAASGLPTEGKSVTPNRAGNIARWDVATCRLSDRVDAVRQQLQKHNVKLCAVLNDHRVLLGQIGAEQLESRADGAAEEIMTAGPTTFRPNAEF